MLPNTGNGRGENGERKRRFAWKNILHTAQLLLYSFKCHMFSSVFITAVKNYLLPRGDKPLDFSLFLAAFNEAAFLSGRFRQACAHTVWQSVCLGTWVGARTRNCPLPQAVATLARTLPSEERHMVMMILNVFKLSFTFSLGLKRVTKTIQLTSVHCKYQEGAWWLTQNANVTHLLEQYKTKPLTLWLSGSHYMEHFYYSATI